MFGAGLNERFVCADTDALVHDETLGSFSDALWPPTDTSFAGSLTVNLSV